MASIVLLGGCAGGGEPPSLERVEARTLPGAWVGPSYEDPDSSDRMAVRDDFVESSSSALPIAHFFYSWDRDPVVDGREDTVVDSGGLPMVSWNDADNGRIADGNDDERVRAAARRFAGLDGPVLLRWGWEMDADSGDGGTGTRGGPAEYVRAWRHLHDVFREEGADNVEWVWCPNAYAFTEQADRNPTEFYPGDDVVDWLCADGYNWYPSKGEWASFETIFEDFYSWAEDVGKPIMIGEFGAQEDPADPARRAAWIEDMARTVKCEMRQIRGLVYFEEERAFDWRLSTSDQAIAAWRAVLADTHFGGADDTIRCS